MYIDNYISQVKTSYFEITNEKFLSFYYELFAITEEWYEVQEVLHTESDYLQNLILESGDLFYYLLKFVDKMNLSTEKIEYYKNNMPIEIKNRNHEFNVSTELVYQITKNIGLVNGLVKKSIRDKSQKIDNILVFQHHVEEIFYNLFLLLRNYGVDIDKVLEINLEKKNLKDAQKLKEKKESKNKMKEVEKTISVTENKD